MNQIKIVDVHLKPEVTIIVRPINLGDYNLEERESIQVRPVWFTPIDWRDKKTFLNAKSWANSHVYDFDKKEWVSGKGELIKDFVVNPMELRIVGFEQRGRGGMAYKVVSSEGFYFDLRQEEFLDAVMSGEVKYGGYMDGKYILEKIGSQIRAVKYL